MRDLEFNIKANDKTRPGFKAAQDNARAFNGELDLTARGFDLAATAARAFVAGFTLTAVADFGRIVRGVITDAADLVDLADKVGVTTGDLQRMIFGFSQAGIAASDVDQILTQWAKRIGEAYTKGGQLADVFKANNLSLTDGNGRLRSSVDLMRSYAELVANAGSEQEQMTLATTAFGKAGGSMVLALKDGTAGFDELMGSAEEAGRIIEEDVMRRAAEIDDEFGKMWQNFETESKSAILNTVSALSQLRGVFAELNADYAKRARMVEVGTAIGAMAGKQPQATKGGRLESPIDQRIDSAFGNVGQKIADNGALERELRFRYSKRTVIPGGENDNESRSRSASAKAARDQETAYERVIERLREEQQVLGLTDIARRVAIEQQRAGVEATSAEGRAIADLVTAIEKQQSAYESAAEAGEFMQDNLRQSFSDLLPQINTGNAALDGFINRLADAASEALFFGSGPLGSLFGSKGGLFGFGGGRAVGGGVDPWTDYLVGENGPEIVRMGSRGGRVGPVEGQGSGGGGNVHVSVGVSVDENGNLGAYVKDIARQEGSSAASSAVTQYDKGMPGRVQQINRNPRRRG